MLFLGISIISNYDFPAEWYMISSSFLPIFAMNPHFLTIGVRLESPVSQSMSIWHDAKDSQDACHSISLRLPNIRDPELVSWWQRDSISDFSSMLVKGMCDLPGASALHSAVAGDKSCRKHLVNNDTYDFGCAANLYDPWLKKVTIWIRTCMYEYHIILNKQYDNSMLYQ